MLTVVIYINNVPVVTRSVRNVTKKKFGPPSDKPDTYHCDDGRTIMHHQRDGCVRLAIVALEGVKEV